MTLVLGHDEAVARWVADRIETVGSKGFGPCAAIGIATDHLVAGMVYHDYQPDFGTVQLSMAATSPVWARRENIVALLDYPFNQLDCFKVWTLTPIDNERALKVNRHVGFTQEAVLAHQFGRKRHGIVMRMLRPDFTRLYGEAHGQE